jgi:hypothetical protein
MGLTVIHGLWLPIHLIFYVVWNFFLPSKHQEVKLFYVTTLFFTFHVRNSKQFFWLSITNFIFLDHVFFMWNGLWRIQIKTNLDCSIRFFHRASWCALCEKTLLVGLKELIKKTNFFFPRFIMCHMWTSLEEFKIKWGYWVFNKLFKNKFKCY